MLAGLSVYLSTYMYTWVHCTRAELAEIDHIHVQCISMNTQEIRTGREFLAGLNSHMARAMSLLLFIFITSSIEGQLVCVCVCVCVCMCVFFHRYSSVYM